MKEEQEISKKRKSLDQEHQGVSRSMEEFDEEGLELSLKLSGSKRVAGGLSEEGLFPPSSTEATTTILPPVPQQEQQEAAAAAAPLQLQIPSQSLSTLLSQPPTLSPLQLSACHPLYSGSYNVSENHSSASLLYPQEPLPLAVPVTGSTTTGPAPSRPVRVRRNPTQAPREGKSETVPPPFPWATSRRATVHSINYLLSKQISAITGEVQCKRCERQYEIEYDLKDKFAEIGRFIKENKSSMHDRAPTVWMTPVLPKCRYCDQENSAKPVISKKKKSINWLFLLLGQMLGCCTLEQLKYFCKHTKNHRTGAKDRVLYLTYLSLCKQLDPNGPFNR